MNKIILAIIIATLGALALWYGLPDAGLNAQDTADSAATGPNSAPAQTPPPEVVVMSVERQSVALKEELPGRTAPFRVAQIRPQVNGIIVERLFEEGAAVEAGDQLYQIDPAMYEAAVASAEANLRNAQASASTAELRANRYAELVTTEAISEQDHDEAQAALEQARAGIAIAEAALTTAELNLEYTRVYAPISGRIGRSYVTEGALVTANQAQALAVITQLDPIFVDVTQSSNEHMQLRRRVAAGKDKVAVTLQTGNGESYEHAGELQFSDVFVDQSTGSVQLRALFPNPDHSLLPGMFINAELQLGAETAIMVPQQAVSRDSTGTAQVWLLQADNTVTPIPVTTERAVGNQWIISEGLDEDDVIVLQGFQRIVPGAAVTAVGAGER